MVIKFFPPYFSGQAAFLIRLSKQLIRHGHDVTVLTKSKTGEPAREMWEGITVIRKGSHFQRRSRFFSYIEVLFDCIDVFFYLLSKGKEFELYHIHGNPDFALVVRILGKLNRKPVINECVLLDADDPVTIKKPSHGPLRFLSPLKYYSFLLCDAYVALSHPIKKRFEMVGINKKKVHQIPQMVNSKQFFPVDESTKRKIRKELGLPINRTVLVSVGAVRHRKGYDVLLRTLKLLREKDLDVALAIVGPNTGLGKDNDFHLDLMTFVESNGLREHVYFTGRVSNVASYLQASDIFVFPSRKEGFPSAIVEAMAVGLPIVVSDLDGTSSNDIFTDKWAGIVIKNHNPSTYAEEIANLILNKKNAERYGRHARSLVEREFSQEVITKKYQALYDSLVAPIDLPIDSIAAS